MATTSQSTIAGYDALLVDLDGVVTKTAAVHAAAWKEMFDDYLAQRARREGRRYEPFDLDRDYRTYVDGKPRYDGVRSFLESRGISLPKGTPHDPPDRETICGLGNRKNGYFNARLDRDGVETYPDAVDMLRAARERGLRLAVVSSSKNCRAVLRAAGLEDLFEARVDGAELAKLGLPGKPAPDMFFEAAKRLEVERLRAVVLEDAVSGVQAGKRGGFGLVVGVDRGGHAAELLEHGADVVLSDLRALVHGSDHRPARALDHFGEIRRRLAGRQLAIFLDYDGTLTPIVDRPELAVLSEPMRETVRKLARHCTVAIVSGRDRRDVEQLVGIESLVYAGSHGFDIAGPNGFEMQHEEGAKHAPILREAEAELRELIGDVPGVLIEPKRYALAVHYRLVSDKDVPRVLEAVDEVAARHQRIRRTGGKKIIELRPRLDWDKGKAVLWLLEALDLVRPDVLPLYVGDDLTDEDAFAALADRGIGILVGDAPAGPSQAHYSLRDPAEAQEFLEQLVEGTGG